MKANTYKSVEGKIEATAVITFFIVFFILTIVAGQLSAQVVNGNSGRCREFDGSTSHITFSSNNMGLGSGNTMTVTAWVKCNSTTNEGSWANIATLNDGNSNGDVGQFWLQHSSDNSLFEFAVMNTSSNRSYIQSVTAPTTGVWYHVAGVYDGSFINIYVNGVLEARTAFTGTINNFQGNFNFNIGQWSYNGNGYRRFNGDIDEVTVWNTALTQTQIRTYMWNLCGNAVKFTEKGGVLVNVSIKSEKDGKANIEFTVKDTGIGIAKERLPRIFDPFVQADVHTTRRYGAVQALG